MHQSSTNNSNKRSGCVKEWKQKRKQKRKQVPPEPNRTNVIILQNRNQRESYKNGFQITQSGDEAKANAARPETESVRTT